MHKVWKMKKKNKIPSFSVGTFLADKKSSDVQLFVKESLDENGNYVEYGKREINVV